MCISLNKRDAIKNAFEIDVKNFEELIKYSLLSTFGWEWNWQRKGKSLEISK